MTPSPLQRRRRVGLLQSESTLGSWKSAIFEQYVRLALDVDRQDSLGERLYNKLFSDRVRCDLAKGRISIIRIILFHSTSQIRRRCAAMRAVRPIEPRFGRGLSRAAAQKGRNVTDSALSADIHNHSSI